MKPSSGLGVFGLNPTFVKPFSGLGVFGLNPTFVGFFFFLLAEEFFFGGIGHIMNKLCMVICLRVKLRGL